MEDVKVLKRSRTSAAKKERTSSNGLNHSSVVREGNLVPERLAAEVDENFLNYLNWNGLANEDNLLVLSSKLHYYYDYDELRNVTTLINLKKLNLIGHLDDFLHNLYDGLSPKANFVGCFTDRKTQKGVNITSRMLKKFLNFLDAKIDMDIDSKDFSKKLESHGFKIIDMTEINGLTYFRTQNQGRLAV